MSVPSVLAIGLPSVGGGIPSSHSSCWEVIKNNLYISEKWRYLVPTIGLLAVGVILQPLNVPIGIAYGVGGFMVNWSLCCCREETVPDENKKEFANLILKNSFSMVAVLPIIEELIFRGFLQPLITSAVTRLIPTAAASFLGTALSGAVLVSIVATSLIFGFVHLTNKIGYAHAMRATLSGMNFGFLAAHFGLSSAIAAHIVNNTIATTLFKRFSSDSD